MKKLETVNPARALELERARALREKNEARFVLQAKVAGLPLAVREYLFAKDAIDREWRFDFAWPQFMIALEVEGAPGRGRHTTAAGFRNDCEKYNAATLLGWSVYRVTGDMLKSGYAIDLMALALRRAGAVPDHEVVELRNLKIKR